MSDEVKTVDIKEGDKVKYRVGRGYSEGHVFEVNHDGGFVMIRQKSGGGAKRKLSDVTKVG